MPHSRHPLRQALPLFLLGGPCLPALDTTAKYRVRDHSLFLVVWARYAAPMLIVTPFVWHRAGPGFWRTRNLRMPLVRSGFLLIAPAALLTPFTYLQMIWATWLCFLVFGQLPDGWSAIGMAIIVGSGLMLALQERRRARLARRFP